MISLLLLAKFPLSDGLFSEVETKKIAQMLDLLLPLAPELGQETSLAFHRPWNSEFGARNGVTFAPRAPCLICTKRLHDTVSVTEVNTPKNKNMSPMKGPCSACGSCRSVRSSKRSSLFEPDHQLSLFCWGITWMGLKQQGERLKQPLKRLMGLARCSHNI